jgi:tRNA nucleotidyltransferase (CCA-adding enzyme)
VLGRQPRDLDLEISGLPLASSMRCSQNTSDSAVRRLARQVKRIDRLVRVARADHAGRPPKPFDEFTAGTWLLERAHRLEVEDQAPTPLVMGLHLLELGVPPGPDMGRLLDRCYEAQLDGEFTAADQGIAYARQQLGLSRHS